MRYRERAPPGLLSAPAGGSGYGTPPVSASDAPKLASSFVETEVLAAILEVAPEDELEGRLVHRRGRGQTAARGNRMRWRSDLWCQHE